MFDEWDMNGYIIIVHYFVISYFIGSLWFFMVRINDGNKLRLIHIPHPPGHILRIRTYLENQNILYTV